MSNPSGTQPAAPPYLIIYALIVGLVVAAVVVSMNTGELGKSAVILNLVIAVGQASLLTLFFMHLKGADKFTWLIVGAGMFFIGLLFVLILMDYFTRYLGAY